MRSSASARRAIRSSRPRSAKMSVSRARDTSQVTDLKGIPILVERRPAKSGEKFVTPQGFTAIRDGIKKSAGALPFAPGAKPRWLRAPLATGARYETLRQTVREHRLSTVCEEAHCPNIGECWNAGTATLLLMGSVCTRACRFCAVDTGNPRGWLDPEEPANAARTVSLMGLGYVVLTSVDRDDLADGGAGHLAACVRAIKAENPRDRGRGADAGLPGRARGRRDGRRFRHRGVRAERRDGRAPHAPGARPARGLPADARRAGARQEFTAGGAHEDEPDARPRRDDGGTRSRRWTTCARSAATS